MRNRNAQTRVTSAPAVSHAIAAAIAAAVLTLAMPALADQKAAVAPAATPVKKSHPVARRHVPPPRQSAFGADSYGCKSYDNMFPPCQSTWPQGSPHYHGPVPGVTFDE